MLRLENFDFGDGDTGNSARLSAELLPGRNYAVRFATDSLPENFIDRYLSAADDDTAGGEIWLTEVRDPAGHPIALRALPTERLRTFLHRSVGVVLRDGGLLDFLTLRENILLPFRYHQVWPAPPLITEAELLERLRPLAAAAGLDLSPAALDRRPAELDILSLRLWGIVKTLVRQPRLVILFAPLSGLGDSAARRVLDLLGHYRSAHPDCLLIFMTAQTAGLEAAFGAELVLLEPSP